MQDISGQKLGKCLITRLNAQGCIPVGCVPPALYCTGGLPDGDPPGWGSPSCPGQRPLDRDPSRRTETTPVNRITDRCENITFPQLRLGAVKRYLLALPHHGYFRKSRIQNRIKAVVRSTKEMQIPLSPSEIKGNRISLT